MALVVGAGIGRGVGPSAGASTSTLTTPPAEERPPRSASAAKYSARSCTSPKLWLRRKKRGGSSSASRVAAVDAKPMTASPNATAKMGLWCRLTARGKLAPKNWSTAAQDLKRSNASPSSAGVATMSETRPQRGRASSSAGWGSAAA